MDVSQAAAALKREWQEWFETVELPDECVYCGDDKDGGDNAGQDDQEGEERKARIVWNGSRARSASVLLEEVVVHIHMMRCRRVRCQLCRRGWTLRPAGMVARRHFQLEVVSKAVSELAFEAKATQEAVAAKFRCDRRTVVRWVAWVAEVFAAEELQAAVLAAVGPVLTALRPVAGLARKALRSARCWLLERAVRVLSLVEVLATARGLEPPGLRSVVRAAAGERDGATTYASPRLRVPDFAR